MTTARAVGEWLVPAWLRRRRTWLGGGILLVVVVCALVYVLGFTSAFSVRAVSVSGVHRITAAQVLAAADVPDGTPLSRLHTGPVSRRVAALPGVARVDVRKAWPSRVRIVVTERRPVGFVVRDGSQWLVDGGGVAFQRLGRPLPGMPRLIGLTAGTRAGKAALSVAGQLPAWLRTVTVSVSARTPDSVTLGLARNRQVVWGGDSDGRAKASALAPLLERPGAVYDVSSPDVVTIR